MWAFFNQTQRPVEGVSHPVEAVSATQSRPLTEIALMKYFSGPLSSSPWPLLVRIVWTERLIKQSLKSDSLLTRSLTGGSS